MHPYNSSSAHSQFTAVPGLPQVYALIAIACAKLGHAVQHHSSRSEVLDLTYTTLNWSRASQQFDALKPQLL